MTHITSHQRYAKKAKPRARQSSARELDRRRRRRRRRRQRLAAYGDDSGVSGDGLRRTRNAALQQFRVQLRHTNAHSAPHHHTTTQFGVSDAEQRRWEGGGQRPVALRRRLHCLFEHLHRLHFLLHLQRRYFDRLHTNSSKIKKKEGKKKKEKKKSKKEEKKENRVKT